MGEYDGSIRINTKIETKEASSQLLSLENRIVKTADRIKSLKDKMDSLGKTQIPTDEYKEVQKQIEKATIEFDKLLAKQEKMQELGKAKGSAWKSLNYEMEELGSTIRYAEGELQDLVDIGKAFNLGTGTDEYKKLAQDLKYAESEMSILAKRHNEVISKQEEMANKQKKVSAGQEEIIDNQDELIDKQKKTGTSGKKNYSILIDMLGKTGNAFKKIGASANSFVKNTFRGLNSINKSTQKTNGLFGTLASRLNGIALSLLLFNWVTRGFNSLLSGVGDGFKNLVRYSSVFNDDMSLLITSINTLKSSMATMFQPIVQIAIPYISVLLDYLTECVNKVNQFFSLLSGKSTWTKAKRISEDYAASLEDEADAAEDAKKALEGYLSPIDEINKYKSDYLDMDLTGAGNVSGLPDVNDLYEEVPIEQGIINFADKMKEVVSSIFAPLKEAWNRDGQFVIDSWKYGLQEVKDLASSVGRDLLEVWNQEKTVNIFQDILRVIGDIGLVVGNLSGQFRKAWEANDTGLRILENIRDLFGAIILNIRKAADYTVDWSKKLNFTPLLEAFERFTASLEPVVSTISGIITNFYTQVLLPLGKWTIEKGLPDLLDIFVAFNERIDWGAIKQRLSEFWDYVEPFAETIGEGLIIFIERVANAIGNFVESDAFSNFLTLIENWMANVTPQEVADDLQAIVTAILAFKIIETVLPLISGLAQVISFLITTFGGVGALIVGVGALVVALIALGDSFGVFDGLKETLKVFFNEEILPLLQTAGVWFDTLWQEHLKPMVDKFVELLGKFSDLFSFVWNEIVKPIIEELGPIVGFAVDGIVDIIGALLDVLGGVIDFLVGVFTGDWDKAWSGIKEIFGGIWDAIVAIVKFVIDTIIYLFKDFITSVKMVWEKGWSNVLDFFKGIWDKVQGTVSNAYNSIKGIVDNILSWVQKAIDKVKEFFGMSNSSSGFSFSSAVSHMVGFSSDTSGITGYASGTVIPATHGEFLARVGDNNRETEVISPMSTIERAVENVWGRMGIGNQQPIVVQAVLDGQVVYESVLKYGENDLLASGNNRFSFGG